MRITYQLTLDDFTEKLVLSYQQTIPIRQFEKKRLRNVTIFMACFAFIILLVSGARPLAWLICYAFIGLIWLRCKFAGSSTYHQLFRSTKDMYAPAFNRQDDHKCALDVTAESICIEIRNQKTIVQWPAVHKLTLHPEFLAIDFGLLQNIFLFKRAIAPAEYQAFCEETIRLYREHAAKEGKIAEVVHSDWTLDKKRTPISDTRSMMTIIWTAGFILLGMSLLSVVPMLMFFIDTFTGLDAGVISGWLMAGVIAFSLMLGLAGLILSLMEKLPGTKRQQSSAE